MQIPQLPDAGPPGDRRHPTIRVGDRVRVRRQHWQVTSVSPYDACSLIALAGSGPSNSGRTLRVVLPYEAIELINAPRALTNVGRRRWWRVWCDLLANDAGPGLLASPRSARIDLMAHQLEPALAVVRGLGARLLIADEVGLGKTVQASLVLAELRARGAAERALVLTPPGLCDQWAGELTARFGLRPSVLGMRDIKRRKAELPPSVNPWSTECLAVASIDYVKRPEVLRAAASCRWDLVIVDEAHGAAPGTDRHAALSDICGRAAYVLLLTATPHSGDDRAFAALCGIGAREDKLLAFRRTRLDTNALRERRVHHLLVKPTPAERHMQEELAGFTRIVQAERADSSAESWLALVTLHKRALSGAYALEQSLLRRLSQPTPNQDAAFEQLQLPLGDDEIDASDNAPPLPAMLRDEGHERRLLERLVLCARAAAAFETKVAALKRLVARIREPIVVFTEYRDTLLHVRKTVAPEAPMVHGGLPRDVRQTAIGQFQNGDARVLFATDAAGQGLNLHQASRVIVNLELPWNPMRLEQRIGRVDRIGQQRRVHAFHLIAADTNEVLLLDRLRARLSRAQAMIGAPHPLAPADWETETALERVAVGGRDPAFNLEDRPRRAEAPAPAVEVMRLQDLAAVEHARLIAARSVQRSADGQPSCPNHGDPPGGPTRDARGPLLLRTRRIHRVIGRSKALVVLRSQFIDAAGRIVGSRLLPVAVLVDSGCRASMERVRQLLLALEPHDVNHLDAGFRAWTEETDRLNRSFWSCRAARERAIARVLEQSQSLVIQGELFDRRAEKIWAAAVDWRAEMLGAARERLAGARLATVLSLTKSQPVLVAAR